MGACPRPSGSGSPMNFQLAKPFQGDNFVKIKITSHDFFVNLDVTEADDWQE